MEGATARADVEWESRMGKSNGEQRYKVEWGSWTGGAQDSLEPDSLSRGRFGDDFPQIDVVRGFVGVAHPLKIQL